MKSKKIYIIYAFIFLSASILLVIYAQRLFYYPNQLNYGHSPQKDGLIFENVYFPSQDGTKLHAWFVPAIGIESPDQAKGTVILVHGNAGNISAHWPYVNWLPQHHYNVFIFDYRGYGHSQGTPTNPQELFEDTQSAIRYVRQRPDVDPEKLFIIGQSLGGNNAISAIGAGETQGIRAIVIDSTFSSYSSIADSKVPGSGVLMNDDYSAERYISALASIPLLFLHGTADRIVPYEQGAHLYEIAPEPKQFITITDGRHITALSNRYNNTYRDQVLRFFENAVNNPLHTRPQE